MGGSVARGSFLNFCALVAMSANIACRRQECSIRVVDERGKRCPTPLTTQKPTRESPIPPFGNSGQLGLQCDARGAHFCDLNLPFLPRVVCCPRFPVLVCIFNIRALDWAIVRVDVDCSEDVLPPLGLSV